jgi:hypothetical protein
MSTRGSGDIDLDSGYPVIRKDRQGDIAGMDGMAS